LKIIRRWDGIESNFSSSEAAYKKQRCHPVDENNSNVINSHGVTVNQTIINTLSKLKTSKLKRKFEGIAEISVEKKAPSNHVQTSSQDIGVHDGKCVDIFSFFVPKEIICQIFSEYLSFEDISLFDRAMCNHEKRLEFLDCVGSGASTWLGDKERPMSSIQIIWLSDRKMKIKNLYFEKHTFHHNTVRSEHMGLKISMFGVHLQWLNLSKQCISEYGMIKSAKGCPNIRYLNVSDCTGINDNGISMIARYCHYIEVLNMANCDDITDQSLIEISKHNRDIKSLKISYCAKVTNAGVISIAESCSNIEKLNIFNCVYIHDLAVIRIAECCRNLKILNIGYCGRTTDSSVLRIAECCPSLEVLNLKQSNISDLGIIKIAECCSNIYFLDISHCIDITDFGIIGLVAGCLNLERLDLSFCFSITVLSMIRIAECCPYIVKLKLVGCDNITFVGKNRLKERGILIEDSDDDPNENDDDGEDDDDGENDDDYNSDDYDSDDYDSNGYDLNPYRRNHSDHNSDRLGI
jgi:hypothetical protein